MRRGAPWILLALGLAAALSAWRLDLHAARLGEAPHALAALLGQAWPPDLGDGAFRAGVWDGLVETVCIAFLATLFGFFLAIPLALLAARNVSHAPVAAAARLLAAGVRVLPSLLWAILAVLVVGLGPLAGVLAMTLYTLGYLAKLQYEAIEGVPRDALEAVRAMGATRFQQAWHVALPEAGNALRSQLLFMLEYNVRASSIIGLVGAGGIGQLLAIEMRFGAFTGYGRVLAILLVLFVTVAVLDALSALVRRRFVEDGGGRRARWRDLARLQPRH